ncbi:MAG: M20/M25/M40 family metallo-hydrolase [Polyangiaceae bacterium]|nr:M20/M25/M40 family metallo-hydrolase [Polyangiaceae bacterium]
MKYRLVSSLGWLLLAACASKGSPDGSQPDPSVRDLSTAAAATADASSAEPIASIVASAFASTPPAASDHLAGSTIQKDAAYLASPILKGRKSGSEDEAAAAAWLANELDTAKILAFLGTHVVPFKYGRSGDRKSANVVGVVEPMGADRKEVVVLGAHYDHLGEHGQKTYWGAEDNASGTAVVLAVARQLRERRGELGRPVVVAFFGSEETGLHGSTALVKAWDFKAHPISSMVNVDMIGRPLVDQPGVWLAGTVLGVVPDVDPDKAVGVLLPDPAPASLEPIVREACKANGIDAVLTKDLPDSIRPQIEDMAKGRSDHAPFENKKVPFVFFSSGESSDYHQPSDTADKLSPAVLESRARAILDTVIALSK